MRPMKILVLYTPPPAPRGPGPPRGLLFPEAFDIGGGVPAAHPPSGPGKEWY